MANNFSAWGIDITPKQIKDEQETQMKLAMLKQQDPAKTFLMENPLLPSPIPVSQPTPKQGRVVSSVMPTGASMSPPKPAPLPSTPSDQGSGGFDQQMLDAYREQMKARQGRLGGIEGQMQNLGEAPSGVMAADLSPLAALVDSWTGSNTRAGYKGPIAAQKYEAQKAALQAALDKERGGLSDDQLNYLKMKADQANKEKDAEMRRQMMALTQARGDQRYELGDWRKHDENVKLLNQNKILGDITNSANNLQFAINNFMTGSATPESFHELQQAVRANLGIKGTSTGSERADTFMKSLGISKDKLTQFLTGNPQSVLESDPAFAHHVLNLAKTEIKNKTIQGNKMIDQLAAGHKAYYAAPHRKDMAENYQDTVRQARERLSMPDASGPQKVRVQYQGKTMEIDESDLNDAIKDGAVRLK